MAWDDAKKAKAKELYLAKNPTPETSLECVKEVATELEESANGVRMILVKEGVYVKKEDAAPAAKTSASGETAKGGRVSKESSIAALRAAIEAAGKPVDDDILNKLTGKAAVYLLSIIK